MNHVMIDLETLGTKPDSVILSLAALKFDPYSNKEPTDGIYIKLDVDQQVALPRTIDEDTLNWWAKQSDEIREEAMGEQDRVSLKTATKELNKFLVGVDKIWAQGPVFDIVILENLYRQLNIPAPWNYWQIADCRTLFSLEEDPRKKGDLLHNPLYDCVIQAKGVQEIFRRYKIKERK